jgi:hypothetical protein
MGKIVNNWEKVNNILIWISIGVLFWFVYVSSNNLQDFGLEQQITIAFIAFLLLFRYIKNIKISDFLEVELKTLVKNALTNLNNATNTINAPTVLANVPPAAITDIDKAKITLENMRDILNDAFHH